MGTHAWNVVVITAALALAAHGAEPIYDFGWVEAERTWGPGGEGLMRLQMHSTDPDLLEPILGQWHSKGLHPH